MQKANSLIRTEGFVQTLSKENNDREKKNEVKWDANYDGKHAIMNLETFKDGKKNHYHTKLNNKDLAALLETPSITTPLDERLENDFIYANCNHVAYPSVYPKYPENYRIRRVIKIIPKTKGSFKIIPKTKGSFKKTIKKLNSSRKGRSSSRKSRKRGLTYGKNLGLELGLGVNANR